MVIIAIDGRKTSKQRRKQKQRNTYNHIGQTLTVFDDLLASSSISDQACLTTLLHSSGTRSGWLKDISQASLCLAISVPEFVIDLLEVFLRG